MTRDKLIRMLVGNELAACTVAELRRHAREYLIEQYAMASTATLDALARERFLLPEDAPLTIDPSPDSKTPR